MKVIFLDIDGVLNCNKSNSRCGGFIGIDDIKVKLLAEIIKQTNAKIILASSWKLDWERFDKDIQSETGNYLDRKLKRQRLYIADKTTHYGSERGKEVSEFLQKHQAEKWIVLDDEIFEDYEKFDILPHLVKTDFYNGGLQEHHAKIAINLLNSQHSN